MRNKYLIGFLVGLVLLIIAFCITVLIMASVKNTTFIEIIRSWFPTAQPLKETSAMATTVGLRI